MVRGLRRAKGGQGQIAEGCAENHPIRMDAASVERPLPGLDHLKYTFPDSDATPLMEGLQSS